MTGLTLSFLAGAAMNYSGRGLLAVAAINLTGMALMVLAARLVSWFKTTPWVKPVR